MHIPLVFEMVDYIKSYYYSSPMESFSEHIYLVAVIPLLMLTEILFLIDFRFCSFLNMV